MADFEVWGGALEDTGHTSMIRCTMPACWGGSFKILGKFFFYKTNKIMILLKKQLYSTKVICLISLPCGGVGLSNSNIVS